MSEKLVTIKVYEVTRKAAKVAAAKAGVPMVQYIGWAVEELANLDALAVEVGVLRDTESKERE